jgi:hypothetical protein
MLQPTLRGAPWWLRAYLLVGAAQGLAIGVTGMADPAHVVGFPLPTTPLNVRFVAAFYLAGAAGLLASAAVRRAVDARIFVCGFVAVTALLLAATVWYWSTYTATGVPYPWVGSYVVEPVVGAAVLVRLGLVRAAAPGRHRLSRVYAVAAAGFAVLGVLLAASPHLAARAWPWALTPVLARTYAAVMLAFALGSALAVRESRPQALRPFALAVLVLLACAGAAAVVHHSRLQSGPSTWIFAAVDAAGIAAFATAAAATWRGAPA